MSYWVGALCGFALFELYYFVRGVTTVVISQMRSPINLRDESVIYGVCTLNDVDFFCNHMNNARYLRELDFARIDYVMRLGVISRIRLVVEPVWIGASTIRYRKPIFLFTPYRVRTRIAHWTDNDVYFAHRFETLHDGFVRAVGYSKVVVPSISIAQLIAATGLGPPDAQPPPLERPLRAWIDFISAHRNQLHEELQLASAEPAEKKPPEPQKDTDEGSERARAATVAGE